MGALVQPAAGRQYPGDWGSSPARSRRPFHRGLLRVVVRVGLLVPKATEGLFKLEAGFAPAARSAVAETGPRGLLASESDSAARACPAASSKATAVCKHPAAANRTCTFGHVP